MTPIELSGYQKEIVNSAILALENSRGGIISAPTGSGKSVMISDLAKELISQGKRVYILHPTSELLEQNMIAARRVGITDKINVFASFSDKMNFETNHENVVFRGESNLNYMTTKTMLTNREHVIKDIKQNVDENTVILVDEVHGIGAPETSKMITEFANHDAKIIGFSATPFREDGVNMLEPFGIVKHEAIIGSVPFEEVLKSSRIMPAKFLLKNDVFKEKLGEKACELIEQEFQKGLDSNLSVQSASSRSFSHFFRSKDPNEQWVAEALMKAVCEVYEENSKDRKLGIIHCDSVELAKHVSVNLNKRVGFVSDSEVFEYNKGVKTPIKSRKEFLQSARSGKFDVLVNCNTLAEGIDIPIADFSLLVSNNTCFSSFIQRLGRTSRVAPDKLQPLFIDLGHTVEGFYNDISEFNKGNIGRVRDSFANLPKEAFESLAYQFNLDENLKEQMKDLSRTRDFSKRNPRDKEDEEKVAKKVNSLESVVDDKTLLLPPAVKICSGVSAFLSASTKNQEPALAFMVDLKEFNKISKKSEESGVVCVIFEKNKPYIQYVSCEKKARAFIKQFIGSKDTIKLDKKPSYMQDTDLAIFKENKDVFKNPVKSSLNSYERITREIAIHKMDDLRKTVKSTLGKIFTNGDNQGLNVAVLGWESMSEQRKDLFMDYISFLRKSPTDKVQIITTKEASVDITHRLTGALKTDSSKALELDENISVKGFNFGNLSPEKSNKIKTMLDNGKLHVVGDNELAENQLRNLIKIPSVALKN